MTAADHTPSPTTDGLREAAIRRIEESRASHLAWAEHIPHCEHCQQHGPPPYIQNEAEHRQIVAMSGPSERDECEHPTWRDNHDGHHNHGWTCTKCGHWQAIAPWVMNGRKDWGWD